MNKPWLSAIPSCITGLLIAILPRILLCDACLSKGTNCALAAKWSFVFGMMIFLWSIIAAFVPASMRSGMSLSLIIPGLLMLLVTFAIGFCQGDCMTPNCQCHPSVNMLIQILCLIEILLGAWMGLNHFQKNKEPES